MKKKVVIIIAAVVVSLAVLIAAAVMFLPSLFNEKVDSSSGTVISVGEVSGREGDTVKVPVKISGNPGFMACMFELEYDTKNLKYVDYKKGDFLKDYETADSDGKVRFISVEDGDTKENGVMVYLNFEILDGAKTSEIKLNIPENSICNYNEEVITAKAENGKVKVK